MNHFPASRLWVALLLVSACGSEDAQVSPAPGNVGGVAGAVPMSNGGAATTVGGALSAGGSMLGTSTGGSSSIVGAGGSASNGGSSVASGGNVSTGGSTSTGGASTASGGKVSAGGSVATGGASTASGGKVSTGGSVATGGSSAPRGGTTSTGGASTASGGKVSTGGSSAVGGSSNAIPSDVKQILYIGPAGSDSSPGTQAQPFATIQHAAAVAQPGTLIFMLAGTYPISAPVNIDAPAGTATSPLRLWAYPSAKVTLDFGSATGAGKGLSVNASYWHVKGLVVANSPGRGIQVMKGDHITIEFCETHHNGDMGLVVSEGATNALILNCDSHHNVDVANSGENADGFGAKSNLGEGTIFRGCRAWANADDGWDLYNCPSGVRFENCWAYKNGDNFLNLANFAGDGNGFKLGKSAFTTSHHVLVNTVAFSNLGGNGFEDNDNISGLTFYNCVAYNNPKAGFEAINVSSHVLKNNISYKNGKADNILAGSDVSHNSWNGFTVSDSDFLSLDDAAITGPRYADGSLPASDFLRLNTASGLIDKGVNVGLTYLGAAPDLGAYECR